MKSVSVSSLEVGTVIKSDIFNENGSIILAGGSTLEKKHIDYFIAHNIDFVFVNEVSEDIPDTQFTPESSVKAYRTLKEIYERLISISKRVYNEAQKEKPDIDINEIIDTLKEIVVPLLKENDILRTLSNIKTEENYLYTHPVNVGLMAPMLAKWLKMPEDQQFLAAVIGFLHDIGKARVRQELFYKSEPLSSSELAEVKDHVMHSYDLLKEVFKDVDSDIISKRDVDILLQVSLSNHERTNGSGYPFGLKGDSITDMAKLIAVIDVYDAITSNRHYRKGISPYVAFKLLKEESFRGLSPKMSQVFLKNISRFFINNKVRLSDGRVGEVVYVNKFEVSRPLVRVGEDFVDLSTNYSVDIIEVIR